MSYPMHDSIRNDVVTALTGAGYNGKIEKKYISKIECPSCHQREAFTSLATPWVVKCGRSNNCGDIHHVKELFPEFFETWTERFQPKTEAERTQNPTAVADAYLSAGRYFDLSRVRGWYTQEWFQHAELNIGSTTVRFPMKNGYWERVLDKPQRFGKQKARCVGEYKGLVWQAPILDWAALTEANSIWITEGIFDAIALMHHGIIAVSNISSSNYPSEFLSNLAKACGTAKRPRIIWAQDSDKAGRNAAIKFAQRATQEGWICGAAQPTIDHDWNDLHQLDKLGDKDVEEYLYYGDLVLAESPGDKALLMYHHNSRREFWFTYRSRVWWFKLDMEAYDRELKSHDMDGVEMMPKDLREQCLRNAGTINCICSAVPTPLYFQQNNVTDESWYYMHIDMPDGHHYKHPFTAKQLTSANEFKNRLLSVAKNAWYTGSPKQLDSLMQDMMHGLKTVDTIDYIGYSQEHKAWIFNDIAVKEGQIKRVNDQDYFEFGKLNIKSLSHSPELTINDRMDEYHDAWSRHLTTAFGTIGVVTTAWWLGSFFVEQIRRKHQSFPFFELVGEPGAGKSTLIEFLWKLAGRDQWEGQDPNKMTVAAMGRYFVQVSNLPILLIEGDREGNANAKQRQFDWDELKPVFNGRPMRSRGVKNAGNDTYEPPVRGALFISQNSEVDASEAIIQRITHTTLTTAHHTPQAKISADWLAQHPVEHLSGFMLKALKAEKTLMELFDFQVTHYEKELLKIEQIRTMRIAKNHSQLLALLECLGDKGLQVFPESIIAPARQFVVQMAIERQTAINSDHKVVVEFWEAFDYIESAIGNNSINHMGDDSPLIAINLKEFERFAGDFRLKCPESSELKKYLRTSRSRKFVESNKVVNSRVLKGDSKKTASVRCWVFEKN